MPPVPTDPVPSHAVSRALVTKLRHHGDVLLASPVLTVLKHAFPAAEVDALVYADTAPMLAGHPALARLHTIDRARTRGRAARLAAEVALLARLRARRYDLLVHLTEHPRGLVVALATGARWAVARTPRRRAWAWRRVYTHLYPWPRGGRFRHTVETNLDALRRLGLCPRDEDKGLVLVTSPADAARAESLIAAQGLARRGFAVLHPGSRWLFKRWDPARTAAVASALVQRGLPVIVTGAPDARERALVDGVLAAVAPAARPRVHDLAGTLALGELAALTARARLFVGIDSAPMHIAAAVGTPVVALFGPTDDVEWGPWRVAHRVVAAAGHPCRPCRNDGCGGGKRSDCLDALPVAPVLAAIDALLAETAEGA